MHQFFPLWKRTHQCFASIFLFSQGVSCFKNMYISSTSCWLLVPSFQKRSQNNLSKTVVIVTEEMCMSLIGFKDNFFLREIWSGRQWPDVLPSTYINKFGSVLYEEKKYSNGCRFEDETERILATCAPSFCNPCIQGFITMKLISCAWLECVHVYMKQGNWKPMHSLRERLDSVSIPRNTW